MLWPTSGRWVVVLAFVCSRLGFGERPAKAFSFGAVAWLIFGVSILSNGIWPMGGPMHGLYGVGIISLLAPTLSLLELRVLRDTRTAYFITVFVSLSVCLYLWLNLPVLIRHMQRG